MHNDNDNQEQLDNALPDTIQPTLDSGSLPIMASPQPNELEDDEYCTLIQSLNGEHRYAYEIILRWCRDMLKSLTTDKPEKVDPVCLFLTGGAGTGKSHLIKAIYHTAIKSFKHVDDINCLSVILAAPTGVAAVNIGASTINTALAIPKHVYGERLPPVSDQRKTALRLKFAQLKFLIIDEVSMVLNIRLKHIHEKLTEILGTQI